MSGKNKLRFLILTAALLAGCAKPNYADKNGGGEPTTQALGSCELQFESENLCVSWAWETVASTTQYGSFLLQTASLQNQGLVLRAPAAELKVLLWMPSMGHGSIPVQIEMITPGLYRVKNVFFIMPGEWDLHFQLWNAGTKVDEATQRMML